MRPRISSLLAPLVALFIAGGASASPAGAAAQTKGDAPAARPVECEALAAADFSGVEDAPAKILSATVVAAVGATPSYCEVTGYAWRNVQFRVRLPMTGWNGKLVVFGTGGQAGSFYAQDAQALEQGYATATHNGGHTSTMLDAQWAYQDESALLDYAYRAPHVAGVIAKAVVRQSYGRAARLAYFAGCSNGGREALQMAQRYPFDFDGIIAGDPSMRFSELFFHLYWLTNRVYGPKAPLDRDAINLLHRHVLDQCDRIDGRADGIIDDPRKCHVDLAPIACKSGASTNCLSPAQSKAAREIYDGPRDASGRQVAYSSAMPGSELAWQSYAGIESYPLSVFRYQTFMPAAGPSFVPDERLLGEYAKRAGGSDALLNSTNPDLRRFRDNGGKLLSYMGWNDPIGGVRETIDYHEMVERVIGGREATADFYRLFMVPGMNHCSGGDGAYQIDWLTALDKWVDSHQAPDSIPGHHPKPDGSPAFSRAVTPLRTDVGH